MFIYPNKPVRFYDLKRMIAAGNDEEWVLQPKWDGHRAIIDCSLDGGIIVNSRHGTPLTLAKNNWQWLSILEIPRPWTLDGELTRDGRLIVWDFAVLGGVIYFPAPYRERLKFLKSAKSLNMKKGSQSVSVIEMVKPSEYKKFLLQRSDTALEGLVMKRLDARDFWSINATIDVGSQLKFRFA